MDSIRIFYLEHSAHSFKSGRNNFILKHIEIVGIQLRYNTLSHLSKESFLHSNLTFGKYGTGYI